MTASNGQPPVHGPASVAQWLGVSRSTASGWLRDSSGYPKPAGKRATGGGLSPYWRENQRPAWETWAANRARQPKLTAEQIAEAQALYKQRGKSNTRVWTIRALAAEYGVSYETMRRHVTGRKSRARGGRGTLTAAGRDALRASGSRGGEARAAKARQASNETEAAK